MPKVTVILTSKDHAKYLKEAIDSVLNQSYKDYELFIWDDASTDNSWDIINKYTDPRIKKFRNSESFRAIHGINKTILELADGEYIAIHHSDDVWETDKLAKQVAYLDVNPDKGAVFTHASAIGEDSQPLADRSHFYASVFFQPNRTRHEWLRFFFFHGNALCHPSVLIRKTCYSECGEYRYGLAQLGDFDMWIRLCLQYEIHVLQEALVRFRVRAGEANSSGQRPEVRVRANTENFQLLNNFFRIKDFAEFNQIFPEAELGQPGDVYVPEYVFAQWELKANAGIIHTAHAVITLYGIMMNPDTARIIKDAYSFDYRSLVEVGGRYDIFSIERQNLLMAALSGVQALSKQKNVQSGGPSVGYAPSVNQGVERKGSARCAILLHLYYDDLWEEMARYIENADVACNLYVSLAGPAVHLKDDIQCQYPNVQLFMFENRGRDIAPRLSMAEKAVKDGNELLLFIHGKKSPHLEIVDPKLINSQFVYQGDDDTWRKELLDRLLSREQFKRVQSRFESAPDVGLIGPSGYWSPINVGACRNSLEELWRRLGMKWDAGRHGFFAGSMFWVRAKALTPLMDLHLKSTDFEEECGQVDGTLAHAVERIFAMVVEKAGYAVEDSDGQRLMDPRAVVQPWLQEAILLPGERRWADTEVNSWKTKPRLTVAIVSTIESTYSEQTRKSLLEQWYPVETVEVSVGENAIQTINTELSEQESDWVAIVDSGSCLSQDAAFRVAYAAYNNPSLRLIYTDEDSLADDEKYENPHFKPDFDLTYLRSMPYMGGILFIRKDLFEELRGFDPRFDGCEEYEFVLRSWERLAQTDELMGTIGHLCGALYHRRAHSGHSNRAVSDILASKAVALSEHLDRCGVPAVVENGLLPIIHRVRYQHTDKPAVSIIIPTRNQRSMLQRCLESIFAHTAWPNFEILIVDNGSDEADSVQYLDGLRVLGADLEGRIRVLEYTGDFNYSAMNNMAARESLGEYLLLLNNDTAALHDDWLDVMMEHGMRPDVGIVGAKLLFPDGGVQHAGVILGMKGPADHPFIGSKADAPGYFGRLQVDQELSAVTGACLLIRRSIFDAVGGLDQAELAVSYSDIDLCLKVRKFGYAVIWTPYAVLLHEGSKSQKGGVENVADSKKFDRFWQEQVVMYRRWLPQIANDPAFNRYLSLNSSDFVVESDVALRWNPEWRPVPRIITQPADRMGCGEYRIISPTRALVNAGLIQGLESERIYSPAELARIRPDALVLQRQVENHQIEAIERHKRFNDVFCVFEIDDLVNNVPIKNVHKKHLPKDLYKRLRRAVGICDRLVVTTDALAEAYGDMSADIKVVPNFIEDARWGGLQPKRRMGRKPRVGWAGGISHTGDLELISGVVEALKDEVEWVFFGMCPEGMRPHIHEFHGPVPLEHYARQLASLNLDLAVAPLEDVPFNHSKSSLRLLEYGILGYPVVCSDLTPYQGDFPVTRVRNRYREWVEAIRAHLADLDASAAQGDALRDYVREHWLLENNLDVWLGGWLPDSQKWG